MAPRGPPQLQLRPRPRARGPAPSGRGPAGPAPSAAGRCPLLPRALKMAVAAGRLLRATVSACQLGASAETPWRLRERASRTKPRSLAAWGRGFRSWRVTAGNGPRGLR